MPERPAWTAPRRPAVSLCTRLYGSSRGAADGIAVGAHVGEDKKVIPTGEELSGLGCGHGELAALIPTVKDPRVTGMISVTAVDVTPDLKFAKVYISVLDKEDSSQVS